MSRAHFRRIVRWSAICLATALPLASQAAAPDLPPAPLPQGELNKDPAGKPKVHLDRLDFPDVVGGPGYKRHLEKFLRKEARRVQWGGGRENRIEYRFEVTELSIRVEGDVLKVTCSAVGSLPGKRSAKSRLTFGGDPARKTQVVHQVLEIVGRGVLTRLSELERRRRGLQ